MAIINAIIPKRTVTTLKVENGVKLKEIAIVWGISHYVYYEVCEGKRSDFEKNYFKELKYKFKKEFLITQIYFWLICVVYLIIPIYKIGQSWSAIVSNPCKH